MSEETHQSGASRLCSGIVMAVCVAPLLLLGGCALLGWNERRAVCAEKAISAGKDVVKEVGCDDKSAGSGSLVMFSCDIMQEKLPKLSNNDGSDFNGVQVQGTGFKVDSAMYQCVETKHEQKTKDKGGGGGETTKTTYTYGKEWKSSPIDSSRFHEKNPICGGGNPTWPSNAPRSVEKYQPEMDVGVFTTTWTNKVPLTSPVPNAETPSGWTLKDDTFLRMKGGAPEIGDVRVKLYTNDPTKLGVTVLGENDNGKIASWTAPDAWLCSGFSVSDLRLGTLSKENLFKAIQAESNSLTMILRLVGFCIMWYAFFLCFGPLEVAADCIPCIGPSLGDCIQVASVIVSCCPATACTLGVCGVVWVVMRPLVGIPLILVWVLIMSGLGYRFMKTRSEKQARVASGLATMEMQDTMA